MAKQKKVKEIVIVKGANKAKKAEIVSELLSVAQEADAMVFADFTGLTHKQMETMKREIKPTGAKFIVAKNTLLKRALAETGAKEAAEANTFEGQTGALFLTGDIVTPLKTISKMVKELQKPAIKFGFLNGSTIDSAQVLKLASLPSRETLLTQLVGTLKSPIFGLHRALHWNIQKFAMTLSAIAQSKS